MHMNCIEMQTRNFAGAVCRMGEVKEGQWEKIQIKLSNNNNICLFVRVREHDSSKQNKLTTGDG